MDDAQRLAMAVTNTTSEQVLECFEGMKQKGMEHDLSVIVHAMVVAIGQNNEKLGGHVVVSLRDVLTELMPKKRKCKETKA